MPVRVQTQDFDVGFEVQQLHNARKDVGAMVNFVGYVRDLNEIGTITTLTLEHYPAMTEKALSAIVSQAQNRWHVLDVLLIHRVGTLEPGEQIVLVAVVSAHRSEAFKACEFIMDYLKTEAPFWKKEHTITGEHWVEAKETDDLARSKWQ